MDNSIALRSVLPVIIVAAALAAFSALYTALQPRHEGTDIQDTAGYRVTPLKPFPKRPGPMQTALTFVFDFGIVLAGCAFGTFLFGLFDLDWLMIYGLLIVIGCILAVGAYRLNRPR